MNKLKAFLGLAGIVIIVLLGANYLLNRHQFLSDAHKTAYATAYEAHALGEPFNLLSKVWQNHTWVYTYQTSGTVEVAVSLVKTQLTGGGYQIQAHQADTNDTVYRDLITGDISVTAKVAPTAADRTGVTVTVTGIKK